MPTERASADLIQELKSFFALPPPFALCAFRRTKILGAGPFAIKDLVSGPFTFWGLAPFGLFFDLGVHCGGHKS
jgi:hypothetical protein